MADIVDRETRSRMMSGIRNRNTGPEITVRSMLHRTGFRFRINVRSLPGTPDIILPKYRAALFVHGCFWHGHDCHLFRWPSSRSEFWQQKICRNRRKDHDAREQLLAMGWRVGVIWECCLKGKYKSPEKKILTTLTDWLRSEASLLEIRA